MKTKFKKFFLNIRFLIILVLMFLLILPNITSLGISPGRVTLDFEPSKDQEFNIFIMNSDNKDMDLKISTEGELKDNINLKETFVHLKKGQEKKEFGFSVSLPEELSPGVHEGEVVIVHSGNKEKERAYVGAELAIALLVKVYVPYPGKYAEAELKITGRDEKNFIIPIINRGEEKISDANAKITIYNEDKKIKTLETNKISLEKGERKELKAIWKPGKSEDEQGIYLAKTEINYDDKKILLEKGFELGELLLDLQQLFVKDFKLGEIAKFNMVVENKWNKKIQDANSVMRIYNQEMKEIASIASPDYDIPEGEQTTMNLYWDTKDVKKDSYNGNVILNYAGKKTQQDFKMDVEQDKIDIRGVGYVISSSEESGEVNIVFFLVLGIVILILGNILWFLYLRNKFKKRK